MAKLATKYSNMIRIFTVAEDAFTIMGIVIVTNLVLMPLRL